MLAVEAFSTLQLVPLVRTSKPDASGILNWLTGDNYQVDISTDPVQILVANFEQCLNHLAADTQRLLNAGRETCSSVFHASGVEKKSPAWIAIQLYYASFYYASALLRLCATSLTYARTSDLSVLRQSMSLSGAAKLPSTGQYRLDFAPTATRISFAKPVSGDGSHEATWKELRIKIDALRDWVNVSPFTDAERKKIIRELDALKEATTGVLGANLLSSTRNDIQYRQMLQAWSPVSKANKTLRLDVLISSLWRKDFDIESSLTVPDTDLGKFIRSALTICALSHAVVVFLASQGPGSFLTTGYRRFHSTLVRQEV